MNKILKSLQLIIFLFLLSTALIAQDESIQLIIRGDDIGCAHAANLACIQSYREGIMRTVEIMVPCAWFVEAVKMLRENPDLDVGVHLTLTSEWENVKWGPVSCVTSFVDSNGNFFPMVWPNKNFPPKSCFLESPWKLEEVEQEFRAQIELALRHIPQVSHISGHMGITHAAPEIQKLTRKLAQEYHLDLKLDDYQAKYPEGFKKGKNFKETEESFIKMLENLTPGLWHFVEHPGMNVPEMQAMGHVGYENVATDRDDVTRLFTSKKVMKVIESKKIKLMSYKDVSQNAVK